MRIKFKMIFFQPLDQFDLYLVNSFIFSQSIFFNYLHSFFMYFNFVGLIFFLFLLFIIFFILTLPIFYNKLKIIPVTSWQFIYEVFIYNFVLSIIVSQVGKRGQAYCIYITTLFFYILISNFMGLVPFSFTITSHIILTFMLGGSSVVGLTIIGFLKQKLHFLELFVPKGVPSALLPLLVFIEVVSYVARGFSLSIRLFANLMSGHSLIHILLFFITKILKFNYIFGFIGLFLIGIIFLLEIGISFLQAYVFAVLVSIYLKDSFEVGH